MRVAVIKNKKISITTRREDVENTHQSFSRDGGETTTLGARDQGLEIRMPALFVLSKKQIDEPEENIFVRELFFVCRLN